MKKKNKDFLLIAGLIIAAITAFWPIWTSGIELDSSQITKLTITNLIITTLVIVYILYDSTR